MAEGDFLGGFRKHWSLLLEISALILGTILIFVLAPPRLTPADDSASWIQLVKFVGALLLAITIVGMRQSPPRPGRLQIATALLAVGAIASLFAYRLLVAAWTCGDYDGRGPIVTGSRLLPEAARDFAGRTGDICGMVLDVAGNTASLWPQSELVNRHLMLAALFLLTALLFLAAAIVAIEMVRGMAEAPAPRGEGNP
jgi:hypothetical protein